MAFNWSNVVSLSSKLQRGPGENKTFPWFQIILKNSISTLYQVLNTKPSAMNLNKIRKWMQITGFLVKSFTYNELKIRSVKKSCTCNWFKSEAGEFLLCKCFGLFFFLNESQGTTSQVKYVWLALQCLNLKESWKQVRRPWAYQ